MGMPAGNDARTALRQLLASLAFLLNLFVLFGTLFTGALLWGAAFSPQPEMLSEELRKSLAAALGSAPSVPYAALLAVKFSTCLASLAGVGFWNSRGDARLALFRMLLLCDILASVALLGFAYLQQEIGPEGYFRVLGLTAALLVLIWAGAGISAAVGPRPGAAGGQKSL